MIHFTTHNSIHIYSVRLEVSAPGCRVCCSLTVKVVPGAVVVMGMLLLLLTTTISLSMFVACQCHFLQPTSRRLTIPTVGFLQRCKAQCMFEPGEDPAWFRYDKAHCTANFSLLSAPVLFAVLRRVTGKSLRNKPRTISALVSHFLSVRSEYASWVQRMHSGSSNQLYGSMRIVVLSCRCDNLPAVLNFSVVDDSNEESNWRQ